MIALLAAGYIAVAALSVSIWPRSHQRKWSIIVKAATWPVWAALFGAFAISRIIEDQVK